MRTAQIGIATVKSTTIPIVAIGLFPARTRTTSAYIIGCTAISIIAFANIARRVNARTFVQIAFVVGTGIVIIAIDRSTDAFAK